MRVVCHSPGQRVFTQHRGKFQVLVVVLFRADTVPCVCCQYQLHRPNRHRERRPEHKLSSASLRLSARRRYISGFVDFQRRHEWQWHCLFGATWNDYR